VNDIHPYIHVGGTFLDSLNTSCITQASEDPSGSGTSATTRVPQSVQDILICIIVLSIVALVDLVGLPIRHFALCLRGESLQCSILIHNAAGCHARTINIDRASSNSEAPGGIRM